MKTLKFGLIILLLLICSILPGVVQYPLHIVNGNNNVTISLLLELIIVFGASLLFCLFIYKKIALSSPKVLFSRISINLYLFVILLIAIILLANLNVHIPNNMSLSQKLYAITGFHSLTLTLISFSITCFFQVIIEELYFRGIIYAFINKYLGDISSIIISSLLFGLAHSIFSVQNIIYHFMFGVLMGTARYKSKGVIIPILLHSIGNLSIIIYVIMS